MMKRAQRIIMEYHLTIEQDIPMTQFLPQWSHAQKWGKHKYG